MTYKLLKPNDLNYKDIIIGYFDIIHLGHMRILENKNACVLTFINVPGKLNPINDDKTRIRNLKNLGFKQIYVFDLSKHNMRAKTFADKYLSLVKSITVGSDCKIGSDHQLITSIIDDKKVNAIKYNHNYSTTLVKKLLHEGKVKEINKILVIPLLFTYKVIKGNQLGRTIGYPTINFDIKDHLDLKPGVYLSLTSYKKEYYQSLTFWGIPKTFKTNQTTKMMETYIINFKKNIYHQKATVQLLQWIAPIIKFESKDELKQAIDKYVKMWNQ